MGILGIAFQYPTRGGYYSNGIFDIGNWFRSLDHSGKIAIYIAVAAIALILFAMYARKKKPEIIEDYKAFGGSMRVNDYELFSSWDISDSHSAQQVGCGFVVLFLVLSGCLGGIMLEVFGAVGVFLTLGIVGFFAGKIFKD